MGMGQACPYNWRVLTDEDKQWIKEQLEKVETTLLTEFHQWASPVESLSDRLNNLEGR